MTDTMKDFISFYGGENQADVYRKSTETTTSMNFISFSDPEGDIASYVNEINAYMGTNIFKVVAATSDEEFAEMSDQMISELQSTYHVDEVFEYFYNDALTQADDVATLVEMSNALNN